MSGEKIIRALDAIPDEQLQSAMSVYDRKKKLKYIWVRVVAALIVLAVVLLLLLGCSSSANAAANTLLPDGPLLGVATWSYPSRPSGSSKDAMEGKITSDLAEEIRDCIQDLSLLEVQWNEVRGQGMMLCFGYEDGSIVYLILTMRNDGNTFLETWSWDVFNGDKKAHYYQLDKTQAAYLMDLIYEMLEQSQQTA